MFQSGMMYTNWRTWLPFGINNSYLCHNFLAITRNLPSGGYSTCSEARVINQWPCIARPCLSLVTSSLKNRAQVEEHGPLTDTWSSSSGHGGANLNIFVCYCLLVPMVRTRYTNYYGWLYSAFPFSLNFVTNGKHAC